MEKPSLRVKARQCRDVPDVGDEQLRLGGGDHRRVEIVSAMDLTWPKLTYLVRSGPSPILTG